MQKSIYIFIRPKIGGGYRDDIGSLGCSMQIGQAGRVRITTFTKYELGNIIKVGSQNYESRGSTGLEGFFFLKLALKVIRDSYGTSHDCEACTDPV